MILTYRTVYPETKGVPLEEMDAVFGESIKAQPQTEYEHEQSSLIPRPRIGPTTYPPKPGPGGWLSRLFKQGPIGSPYHSVEYEELTPLNTEEDQEARVGRPPEGVTLDPRAPD
ncbi:hypothetical protein DXG01_003137 [Tephrocybe rancida]|nr:hypothetical protein DXG01_003137 [Tephrocybe rancida]